MVNAKIKVSLKSSIMVRNTDFHYPRGYCPSQNTSTKVQTQSLITKESKLEKSKSKDSKLANRKTFALPYTNELGKTSYQDKKKEYFKKK